MARRIWMRLGFVAVATAMTSGAAVWFLDQAAYVTTTDARVRTRMITLSAEIAGRIADMPIAAGSRIASGETLIRLDDGRARLALAAATLDLRALEIETERARLDADVTRDRSRQRIASSHSSRDAAAADVAAARATLARAEADHARTSSLHASGLVAQAGMDRSIAALEIARQAAARAEAELVSRHAGVGEAEAEARTADLALHYAHARAMSAHALRQRIALLKVELAQHAIVSPIDGVIDEVFAEPGEYVAPGARLALAHATSDLWLEANIKETELPRVRAGASADIRLDAARTSCQGVVERIGDAAASEFALIPNANPAGVFTKITQRVPVRIRLGAGCREARPGAMATLRIRAA
jgi:membrane fusion protein (multidrug efflux system)